MPSELTPGQKALQALRDSGYGSQNVQAWQEHQTSSLREKGYSEQEISAYWGDAHQDTPVLRAVIEHNVQQNAGTPTESDKNVALLLRRPDGQQKPEASITQMWDAGWDTSVAGLMMNGKLPELGPQDSGFFGKMAFGIAEAAGDLPVMMAGFFAGAAGGAKAGKTFGPKGAIIGGAVGAGAGSMAVPEAIRQTLMDAYEHGELVSWEDFARRSGHILWETTKAGLAGGAGGYVAPYAGPLVSKVGSRALGVTGTRVAADLAGTTAFATTSTSVYSGLSGHVPDAQDFALGVGMGLSFTLAGHTVGAGKRYVLSAAGEAVEKNMRGIYEKTGVHPREQGERAAADPVYKQEIISTDPDGNPVYKNFRDIAPEEPPTLNPKTPPSEPPSAPVKPGDDFADVTVVNARGLWIARGHYKDGNETILAESSNYAEVKKVADKYKTALAERQVAEQQKAPLDDFKVATKPTSDWMELMRRLEGSGDDAISPAGAVGRYQIMPDTARQYGFDPAKLKDPAYNEKVANAVLSDLMRRFRKPDGGVDTEAVLIAYNAGPGRAIAYRARGRNVRGLPAETQRYLEHADAILSRSGLGGGGKEPPSPPGGPEITPPPGGPKKLPKGFELNEDMLASKVLDIVDNPARPGLLETGRESWHVVEFAATELAPQMRQDKLLGLGANPHDLTITDMFRSVYASVGRAKHMIEFGPVDAIDLKPIPGKTANLRDAWRLGGDGVSSMRNLNAYRIARRAIELEDRGVKTGVDMEAARALVAKSGKKYDAAMEMFREANDAKLQYMRDSGMYSDEAIAKWKENNRDWYPTKRATEEGGTSPFSRGSRFGPIQAVKTAAGSIRKWRDPVEAEIQSFYSAAANADKNRAVSFLVEAMKLSKEDSGLKLIESKKAEMFDKDGNPVNELFDQNTGPLSLGDRQIAYYDRGVRKVYEVNDPQLAQSVRGVTPIELPYFLKPLQWVAALKRSGITHMPDFVLRAVVKDAIAGPILNKNGGAPFEAMFRGMADISGMGPAYREFMTSGGFGASLADMDANYTARSFNRIMRDTGTYQNVINRVAHPLEAAQLLMQRMDALNRIGVYKIQTEKGFPNLKAAMNARKFSLDFAERSGYATINLMTSMTAFMRPSILGLKLTAEALKERPGSTIRKSMTGIVMPMASLYALNYLQDKYGDLSEEEKYKNLPRWERDTYFILPQVGGVRLRLQLPPDLGPMVGGLTVRMLDHFSKESPAKFEEWAVETVNALTPPIMASATSPVIEHVTNHSFFTGRPLVPARLEGASGHMQYTRSTTEVSTALSRFLGAPGLGIADVSPIVLDNYARGIAGSAGIGALRLLNGTLREGPPPPEDLRDTLSNNPFIGSFFVRHPDSSAQPIIDFMAVARELRKSSKDLSLSKKRYDFRGYEESAIGAIQSKRLDTLARGVSSALSVVEAVSNHPSMTPVEKRQYIDDIYGKIILMSRQGTVLAEQMKKQAQELGYGR